MRLFETEHKQPLIFSPTQNATAKFQLHLLPCAFAEKLDWRNFGKKVVRIYSRQKRQRLIDQKTCSIRWETESENLEFQINYY
jgi:hypothetical protein